MIEETIKSSLNTLGYAAYPNKKVQDAALPCVVYKRISRIPNRTQNATDTLRKSRFQFDVLASTYSEMKIMSEAIITAFDATKTYFTEGSFLLNDFDVVDEVFYRHVIEFFIFYKGS